MSNFELVKALQTDGKLLKVLGLPADTTDVHESRSVQRFFADADADNDDKLSWTEFMSSAEKVHAVVRMELELEAEHAEEIEYLVGMKVDESVQQLEKQEQPVPAEAKAVNDLAEIDEKEKAQDLDSFNDMKENLRDEKDEKKVSRLQVQQLNQIYTITDCCLTLSALGS